MFGPSFWLLVSILSLLFGQLGAITIAPNVTVYIHDIMFHIFCVISGFQIVKQKRFSMPFLGKPLIGFLGVACISLLSNSYKFSFDEVVLGALYFYRFALYVGVYFLSTQENIHARVLQALTVSGVLIAILGGVQYVLYPDLRYLTNAGWDPHLYRLVSTLLDPNFTGIFLVISLFVSWFLFVKTKQRRYILVSVLLSPALLLTYSRSSLLAFVFGLWVWLGHMKKLKEFLLVCVIVVVLALAIPKPGGKTLQIWRSDSVVSRLENWSYSWGLFVESPILGHGFNLLRAVQKDVYPTVFSIPSKAGAGVDSSLLFVLVTTGIVGASMYMWMFITILQLSQALYVAHPYHSALLLAVWSSVFVHSFFSNSLFYPWSIVSLFLITGAIERISKR